MTGCRGRRYPISLHQHSPVLVARFVPVEVTLLQDDVLSSFDQTQVVRFGAREVIHRHHHLLLLVIVMLMVRGWGGRRRKRSLALCEEGGGFTRGGWSCEERVHRVFCGYLLGFGLLTRNWG